MNLYNMSSDSPNWYPSAREPEAGAVAKAHIGVEVKEEGEAANLKDT